jgi:N-acetylneuraminic acid mutarotase
MNPIESMTARRHGPRRRLPAATTASALLAGLLPVILSGCNLGLAGGNGQTATGSTTSSSTMAYSIGGSISGLSQSGLSLTAAGSNTVTVAAGATSFTLPNPVASGMSYTVSVKTQPQGESCRVDNASGMVSNAAISTVQVSCTLNAYPIGGTVTGLNAAGLVLDDGTETVTVAAGASAFVFPTHLTLGTGYAVVVQTQPTGLTCQVSNASGTVGAAAVTNLLVSCGQWTWMGGASQIGAVGSYGTRGSAASSNTPGARSGAVSWIDHAGNLWLFGGSGAGGLLNDLWEYTPGTGEWTWMAGSSTGGAAGSYGTQGQPGGTPGARTLATAWVDAAGNLWLFGGQGDDASGTSGSLNDLWKYSTTSNQWTWVAGASSAWASGDMPPNGMPGGRSGAVGWVDASGDFWLFGGSGPLGLTNDLWQYVPGTGAWTLVSGSQTSPGSSGVYGMQGTAAMGNTPGSRTQAVAATDASGNLWLFGGSGFASIGGSGLLNDLWEFSPSTQLWAWMGGWKSINGAGVYGTRSTTDVNDPGARYAASAVSDASGNLWLFGGVGYDINGKQGPLNDLWEYDTATGKWIWMGGAQISGAAGIYGTLGAGAAGDGPGARSVAVSWMDGTGTLWLFGGQGLAASGTVGLLNDLWQFVP